MSAESPILFDLFKAVGQIKGGILTEVKGKSRWSSAQYQQTHSSRLSHVSWRAGMDTPRDHHTTRHGNKKH